MSETSATHNLNDEKRQLTAGETITKLLLEGKRHLEEALEILSHEPVGSTLRNAAEEELQRLK